MARTTRASQVYLGSRLGIVFGRLEALLAHLEIVLGLSWGHLGNLTSGLTIANLGSVWLVGLIVLGRLGPSWGHLGADLGPFCPILGPSWAILKPSWAILGPSWDRLG